MASIKHYEIWLFDTTHGKLWQTMMSFLLLTVPKNGSVWLSFDKFNMVKKKLGHHWEIISYKLYKYRLQLKRGLFWYWHHPKMHEMVSDRSSRAENLTDLRKISMRILFKSKKCGKMTIWSKKTQKCHFFVKKNLWEATQAIPKLEKTNCPI